MTGATATLCKTQRGQRSSIAATMPKFSQRYERYGTQSERAMGAAIGFEEAILSYGKDAALAFDAVEADPQWGLAHAYAAAVHLFRINRAGESEALRLLAGARACRPADAEEAMMIAAVNRWAHGHHEAAAALLADLLLAQPNHLFAGKLAQHLFFSRGHMRPMLRCAEMAVAGSPQDARSHGMLAFALDQNGHGSAAERAARHALALGEDPWAHHAMAHLFDSMGRHREGMDWMIRHRSAWSHCSSFLYTHNEWHGALFHLAEGDSDGALALFHDAVWTQRKHHGQDQINAISLLARIEMAGVEVGDRWQDVADHCVPACADAYDGFLDLHYAYVFARAGRDEALAALILRLTEQAERSAFIWRHHLPTAARAVADFARGDHDAAARKFAVVGDSITQLGGSLVQQKLFFAMQGQPSALRPARHRRMALA